MSENRGLPRTPEEAAELMNSLTFEAPDREAELLEALPPQGSEFIYGSRADEQSR